MQSAEFGENTRAYISEYIRFADAKAAALFAIAVGVLSIVGSLVNLAMSGYRSSHVLFIVIAVLAGLPHVVAAVMTVLRSIDAVAPRVPAAARSLASFPDIATMTDVEYQAACRSLTPEAATDAYSLANAKLSKVAAEKYASITDAVWWLRIQVLSGYVVALLSAVVFTIGE